MACIDNVITDYHNTVFAGFVERRYWNFEFVQEHDG